ncbi:hypothetical protein Val02_15220 [Virgisporangium aliadipatigenens]|uniref:Trypsin-co-occurring domain-containing protein n=1 Tax=Virgisporangium aliadipatigenens TaxID=741659 RepID=A0A8J4DP85_9ACTN|nr:CU044_2847 family protein [Virgisporangium aliadipatigenens]GIJ44636.1 hypothetical protein Val02_15220 [Virgisporangium aliadipatigenens]
MLLPVDLNGVSVLVETTSIGGTEPTSGRNRRTERASDMFADAQTVIEEMAISALETGRRICSRAGKPDQLEIQFGLKFATQGTIIVASASAEASLVVKIVFGATPSNDSDTVDSTTAPASGQDEQ